MRCFFWQKNKSHGTRRRRPLLKIHISRKARNAGFLSAAKLFSVVGVFALVAIGIGTYVNLFPKEYIRGGARAVAVASSGVSASTVLPIPLYPQLDIVAYNNKLRQLAHFDTSTSSAVLQTLSNATSSASSASSILAKTSIRTATAFSASISATTSTSFARFWPVAAAYPENGAAILPFKRIVAFYGNPSSTAMGVLGEYPSAQMLAMLQTEVAQWQAADPTTLVMPAFDYIAVTAQASPEDGTYRLRMPASQIDSVLNLAQQVNGIVFLDIQPGLSNLQTEIPLLEPYLKLPQVELALDPEFAMHNKQKPGMVIGSMDASDINYAAGYLADLVHQYNLPPKILIVHRFTQDMVTNTQEIKPLPEVQMVIDMDGWGAQSNKIATYQDFITEQPVQFSGFKLFYKNDTWSGATMMTPAQVLKLTPSPSFIEYQ